MNRYAQRIQEATLCAEKVLFLNRNSFLDSVSSSMVRIDENAYIPEITQMHHLCGFRMRGNTDSAKSYALKAARQWLLGCAGIASNSVFMAEKDRGQINIFYGSNTSGSENAFSGNLPECQIQQAQVSHKPYNYNGIISGTVSSMDFADMFAKSKFINKGYVACISICVHESEIQDMILENRRLLEFLGSNKSFERIYGNATRRVEEIPVETVMRAMDVLRDEIKYLEENKGKGFFRTAIRFGADSLSEYNGIVALIQASACFERENRNGFEALRCFDISDIKPAQHNLFAIPCIHIGNNSGSFSLHAVTLQDADSVASFCTPPINSYKGYYVGNYDIGSENMEAFPLTEPILKESISIGKIMGSDCDCRIPKESLLCHSGIFGATNTGKTTTVKKIISELYNQEKIPFVVIEAAKKEYNALLGSIPELSVYTPGLDGIRLNINPLQPEDGTLIESHAEAVTMYIVSAMGSEQPIPTALSGLLKLTYEKFGWHYGTAAYTDRQKPFPTFADVYANVDEYIEKSAKYGPEVKQNLKAALKLRSENMSTGALGKLFSDNFGMTAKDFLNTPAVIELSDLGEESTHFLMNILMYKFQRYLSRLAPSDKLRQIIVVEEAHNVFRKTISEESGLARSNAAFEKMLAEIRASGTGIILSDQRPSIMPEAVMANTAVKITHATESEEDVKAISGPMVLSEFQCKKIKELSAGECVISLRGHRGVQHGKITPFVSDNDYSASCLLCKNRFRCKKVSVKAMIDGMDKAKADFHISKIISNPYNTEYLLQTIVFMLKDLNINASNSTKCCILGEMLKRSRRVSFNESRVIVNSFSEYLRRVA